MSPKIKLDLSDVRRCAKPGCKHAITMIARHHLRHEKTWINFFDRFGPPDWPDKTPEPGRGRALLIRLKERYHAFRPQDTVDLCEWHHVEIHAIYRNVILDVQYKFKASKNQFGWYEVVFSMRECKKACRRWLKTKTPGLSPVAARKRGAWG